MRGLLIQFAKHYHAPPGERGYATFTYRDEYGDLHHGSTDDPEVARQLNEAFIHDHPVEITTTVRKL